MYINQDLIKKAKESEKKIGPYKADTASKVLAEDAKIDAIKHNREEHPLNYGLNPFVGSGPISEVAHRVNRRVNASRSTSPTLAALSETPGLNLLGYPLAALMGTDKRKEMARQNYDSHDEEKKEMDWDEGHRPVKDPSPDLEEGPVAVENAGKVLAGDKRIATLLRNKEKHPGHWWANPFVGGPISLLAERLKRRHAATAANHPWTQYAGPIAGGISAGAENAADAAMLGAGGEHKRIKARDLIKRVVKKEEKKAAEEKKKKRMMVIKHTSITMHGTGEHMDKVKDMISKIMKSPFAKMEGGETEKSSSFQWQLI